MRHLTLPFALLAAVPLSAQLGFGGLHTSGRGELGEGHLGGIPGTMTRTAWGELTGDLRPDACVLVGNRPVFLFNAGLHHALTDLPATGTEMTCLRGGAPDGRDGLLLSSVRGLELWWLSESSQTFEVEALGGAAWKHCLRLRSADLLGDGGRGVVGLRADGHALLLRSEPRDPATEVVLPTEDLVHDFVLLQWDGEPGLEIAMHTAAGFRITDLALAPLFASPAGGVDDLLAVIRRPDQATDRVATLIALPGARWLFCADKEHSDPGVWIGAIDPVEMLAADWDADGQQDLLLSQRTTAQLVLFHNRQLEKGYSFDLDPDDVTLLDPTSDGSGALPAPWNDGVPSFVDLDADGDADVLHPLNVDKNVVLLRSDAIDQMGMVPSVLGGCFQHDEDTGHTTVTLDLGPPRDPLPVPPDVLEVVLWRQPEPGQPTEPVPISYEVVPLEPWPMSLVLQLDEPLPSAALHHVQLRLGKVGSGRWAGPSVDVALSGSAGSVAELAELYGIDPDLVLSLATSEPGLPCGIPELEGTVITFPLGSPGHGKPTRGEGGYVPFSDEGASSVPMPVVPCFTDGWIPWGI